MIERLPPSAAPQLERFGCGGPDFALLSLAARAPGIAAQEMGDTIPLATERVFRILRDLRSRSLVRLRSGATGEAWNLRTGVTPAGVETLALVAAAVLEAAPEFDEPLTPTLVDELEALVRAAAN